MTPNTRTTQTSLPLGRVWCRALPYCNHRRRRTQYLSTENFERIKCTYGFVQRVADSCTPALLFKALITITFFLRFQPNRYPFLEREGTDFLDLHVIAPPQPPVCFRKQVGHEPVMEVCRAEPVLKKYLLGHSGDEYRDQIKKQFNTMIKFCSKETPPPGRYLESFEVGGICGLRWKGEFKN